jgi:hypothetical protein
MPKKVTALILKRLQEIIESEGVKLKILGGNHKKNKWKSGKMSYGSIQYTSKWISMGVLI